MAISNSLTKQTGLEHKGKIKGNELGEQAWSFFIPHTTGGAVKTGTTKKNEACNSRT